MNIKNSYFNILESKLGYLSFGQALKSFRLSDNMSQKDFAIKLKISPQNLNDLENNRKIPSPKRAAQIAKHLKLPEIVFIQFALRDQLRKDGFNYEIKLG
jgi:transcriptional regulator with XRE-family HTH domain